MVCGMPISGSLQANLPATPKAMPVDYAVGMPILASNIPSLTMDFCTTNLIAYLSLGFDERFDHLSSLSSVSEALSTLQRSMPIVLNAFKANVPAILYFASLYDRAIHISHVSTREVVELIALSKAKGVKVTCDVCVHNLFYSKADGTSDYLAEADDVEALWENMGAIDCFVIGCVPAMLAVDLSMPGYSGYATALALLLSACKGGRLTFDTIREKFHDNPIKIFRLPEQSETYIEVEADASHVVPALGAAGPVPSGRVHRVVLRGSSVHLDGVTLASRGRLVEPSILATHKPSISFSSAAAAAAAGLVGHQSPIRGSKAQVHLFNDPPATPDYAGASQQQGSAEREGALPMSQRKSLFQAPSSATKLQVSQFLANQVSRYGRERGGGLGFLLVSRPRSPALPVWGAPLTLTPFPHAPPPE